MKDNAVRTSRPEPSSSLGTADLGHDQPSSSVTQLQIVRPPVCPEPDGGGLMSRVFKTLVSRIQDRKTGVLSRDSLEHVNDRILNDLGLLRCDVMYSHHLPSQEARSDRPGVNKAR